MHHIVAALLQNSGFELIDVGKDAPAQTIVEAAKLNRADIVGLCALMTTTMTEIETVVEALKADVQKLTAKKLLIDVKEIKRPDKEAQLVAENIAKQLEERVGYRRAVKSNMGRALKSGALGIKCSVGGRLGGADIARTEFYSEGTIPLQTRRADIDYGFAEADTTYGKVGVKVWIYKGEVLPAKKNKEGSEN